MKEKEVYLVTFYFYTFKTTKLNYNTYNKELFAVFEAFHTWYHYLEGFKLLINVITDYKILEYFSATKVLSYYQERWSEFLSQFNLIIHFYSSYLESKHNTLTHKWDLYSKEESVAYTSINLHNFCPIFTHSQLTAFLHVTTLVFLFLHVATL